MYFIAQPYLEQLTQQALDNLTQKIILLLNSWQALVFPIRPEVFTLKHPTLQTFTMRPLSYDLCNRN